MPLPSTPILRLGLRYVRGLRKGSADALVRARNAGPFSSIEDLTMRVPELHKSEWTRLAQIGSLNGLGDRFHRRDALWQVERAVRPAGELFKQTQQEDAPSPLSQMTDEERLVTDFHGTGLTVGRHPMAHRRAEWDGMNIKRACDLKAIPDGRFTRIAGCVIARPRACDALRLGVSRKALQQKETERSGGDRQAEQAARGLLG